MPDREKVIKGLEGISDYFFDIYRNDTDSYKCAKAQEYSDVAIDAIALLKEHEAVEPVKQIEQTEWTVCGICHNHIISKWIFCPYCGRSVKWE